MKTDNKSLWRKMLWLSILEGMVCLLCCLLTPAGSGSGSIWAFSTTKIILCSLALAGIVILVALLLLTQSNQRIDQLLSQKSLFLSLLIGGQLLALLIICLFRSLFLLYHSTEEYYWYAILQRSKPLLIWLLAFSIQSVLAILYLRRKELSSVLSQERRALRISVVILLGGILFAVFVYYSRIGLVKENAFFGKPTVPLLEWHLMLSFLFCLSWILLERLCCNGLPCKIEHILPLLIWLCAVVIWLSIPNQLGFFSPPGRAPNFEVYPFSDGAFYGHYARSITAGMGMKGQDIPPRPLYIALLAIFHFLADNQYEHVIFLQTLLLGMLPVLIYFIGKELHSTSAGICAAMLCILRETNAILSATFGHNVSTTKYFFSDLPTALAAVFLTLMVIRWFKTRKENNERALFYAFLSGTAMGIICLFRTQSMSLLLVILPFCIIGMNKRCRFCLEQTLVFAVALMLMLAPWLIRNYQITGQLVFDHPVTQTGELANNYNFEGMNIGRLPDEDDGAYTRRLSAMIQQSLHDHPDQIAAFIVAHFSNNIISSMRVFPIRGELDQPSDLLRPESAFWETMGNDKLTLYNLVCLGLLLAFLGFGVGAAYQHSNSRALIPLHFWLVFNLSTAIGRYSAGRYLIPMDWSSFLFFGIACAEWCQLQIRIVYPNQQNARPIAAALTFSKRKPISVAIVFTLLAALILPLTEHVFPLKLVTATREEVFRKFGLESEEDPQISAIKAIALYPRYYAAGEGEPESAKQGYAQVDYGRLVFLTMAPGGFGTIELRTEELPQTFPDGATVWLLGCQQGATTLADHIFVETDAGEIRYDSDNPTPLSCENY